MKSEPTPIRGDQDDLPPQPERTGSCIPLADIRARESKAVNPTGLMSKVERDLDEAVYEYERASGFQAIRYRTAGKTASLELKLQMASADLCWFESHVTEVQSRLKQAISNGIIAA